MSQRFAGCGGTEKTVFRPEHRLQTQPRLAPEPFPGAHPVPGDGGRMADQPQPPADQPVLVPLEQKIDAGQVLRQEGRVDRAVQKRLPDAPQAEMERAIGKIHSESDVRVKRLPEINDWLSRVQ